MLILTADEVRRALPMRDTIEAMKRAYASLSDGRAEVPLRTRLPIPPHEGLVLFMPAYVQAEADEALAVKIVSLFPGNPGRGLAFIQAAVLVLEADTGRALALLEGSSLTTIRTGAGSGAAIDLLARPDSRTMMVFGAGAQARTQVEAACTAEMAGRGPIPVDVIVANDSSAPLQHADIVCTATTSSTPVFADYNLKTGAHVSAIGSYTPEMQEVPAETVVRARVVVDSISATLAETGDLVKPIIVGEADIVIADFKSVGVAVQDAMAAQVALKNAKEMGLGQNVNF